MYTNMNSTAKTMSVAINPSMTIPESTPSDTPFSSWLFVFMITVSPPSPDSTEREKARSTLQLCLQIVISVAAAYRLKLI